MASKGLDGSAFSFSTTRGHTTHISILWVFVLFTFFAVVLVSLAGFQEGLKERQFPDAKVNGDLDVTGVLKNDGYRFGYLTSPTQAVSGTLATNTDFVIGVQPANTILTEILVTPSSNFVTAGNANDDLDFSMGTAAGGAQIITATAILNDGGAAVTLTGSLSYNLILNGSPTIANGLDLAGGDGTNPATSEVIGVVAGALSTTVDRTLHARFTPLQNNLGTTGNMTVSVRYESLF